jgi:hypothetical protein
LPTSQPPTSDRPGTTGGPDTTSGSSTSVPVSIDEQLRLCEESVRTAHVVFSPVQTMVVGEVSTVTVKASIEADPPELDDPATTAVETLDVHCFLWARLRGGDFRIDPEGFDERSFLEQSTVTWVWHVEPEETGDLELILEVQSRVEDRAGLTKAFEAMIRVEAEDRTVIQTMNATASGVVTHPVVAFLGLGGVLAVVAWLVGPRRSSRKGRPDAPEGGSA